MMSQVEIKRWEAQGRWSEQREQVPGTSMVLRWGPGPAISYAMKSRVSNQELVPPRSESSPWAASKYPWLEGAMKEDTPIFRVYSAYFHSNTILGSCNQLLHMWNVLPFFYSQEGKIRQNQGMWHLFFCGMDSLQKTSKNYYNYFVARTSLNHSPLPSLLLSYSLKSHEPEKLLLFVFLLSNILKYYFLNSTFKFMWF